MGADAVGSPERHSVTPPWRQVSRHLAGPEGAVRRPLLFLAAAMAAASIASPIFLHPRNLEALAVSSTFLVVASVGEAFVILVGSIDLGPQSVLAAFAMLAGWLAVLHGVPAIPAVAATLAGAMVLGLVVGWLVAVMHIPSFIVTLGTYWGMRGIALLLNGGSYISPDSTTPPHPFGFAGLAASPLGISNLILIAVVVVAAAQVVVSYTPFGMRLRSMGSSEIAARRVGLRAVGIKISVFVISALLAAVAGVMITAWQGAVYPLTGQGYSLEAIAAVILGGIPFTGGRGTIVGVAIGALLIGVINDVIVLVGLPSLYEYIFIAIVLVVAGLQARGGPLTK